MFFFRRWGTEELRKRFHLSRFLMLHFLPCIHEKLADCLSCCFSLLSFASRYKVYEFNNCSWYVVASSIGSSNPRHTHFLPLSMKNRGNYWAHPNPNACCTLHTNSLATFRHFPINCSINIQPRAILLHSKSPYYAQIISREM